MIKNALKTALCVLLTVVTVPMLQGVEQEHPLTRFYRDNPTEDLSGAFTHQLKSEPPLNKFDGFNVKNIELNNDPELFHKLHNNFGLFYNFFYLIGDDNYISFELIKSHTDFLKYNDFLTSILKKIRSEAVESKKKMPEAGIKEKSEVEIKKMLKFLQGRHLYIPSLSNDAMIILSPAAVSINDYGVWLNDGWEVERAMEFLKGVSTKLGYQDRFPEQHAKIVNRSVDPKIQQIIVSSAPSKEILWLHGNFPKQVISQQDGEARYQGAATFKNNKRLKEEEKVDLAREEEKMDLAREEERREDN